MLPSPDGRMGLEVGSTGEVTFALGGRRKDERRVPLWGWIWVSFRSVNDRKCLGSLLAGVGSVVVHKGNASQ